MSKEVVVLDYGSGNVHSAVNALGRQGAKVTLSSDPTLIAQADGLVVPGVGAFQAVMQALESVSAGQLIAQRLKQGGPVLGICVGMQVMFETGLEHGQNCAGLGFWPGEVSKLQAGIIPHMGWSKVQAGSGSRLFAGLEGERFYFVHSYAAKDKAECAQWCRWGKPVFSLCHHGQDFLAAVETGPLSATQFHPEKSGPAGGRLLKNWIDHL